MAIGLHSAKAYIFKKKQQKTIACQLVSGTRANCISVFA